MSRKTAVADTGQQVLCLLQEVDPFTPGLVLELGLRLGAGTDVGRLVAAVDRLVARYPALRTRFDKVDGEWRPLVDETGPRCALWRVERRIDEAELMERLLPADRPPLELRAGPLFQATVVDAAGFPPHLVVRIHHAVVDLWSVGLLATELAALYIEGPDGSTAPAVTAADRVDRVDRVDREARAERGWTFWRRLLREESAFVLPGVPAREPVRRAPAHVPVVVDAALTERLDRTAKAMGVTRYAVLVAAQALVLAALSGSERVPVGICLHGRRSETYREVGYHVATVPLPVDTATGTGAELVARVGSDVRAAQAHQVLGYPELVARARVDGDVTVPIPDGALLLQQDTPGGPRGLVPALLSGAPVELGPLMLQAVVTPPSIGPFGIATLLTPQDGELVGRIELDPAHHPIWVAECAAPLLLAAINQLTAAPDTPLRELTLLDDAQRLRLRYWGESPLPVMDRGDLAGRVLSAASLFPSRTAISAADGELSYRELADLSATVAAGLAERGIGPGDAVGVGMSRGRLLPVVLLAVLRCGAAYVPIDPAGPVRRVAEIVADAHCRVVVTTGSVHAFPQVRLDDLLTSTASVPSPVIRSDSPAYVLFTSGSTGRPKGVVISHANVANLIAWAHTEFTSDELSSTLAVTPITFDLSVFELFVPLSAGHRVCLLNSVLDLLDAPDRARGASLLNTVPSAVRSVVDRAALPGSLLVVNMAGEPIQADLVTDVHRQLADVRVMNLYGPSETTTYSTVAELPIGITDPVPIGTAVGGTRLEVVDSAMRTVPIGTVGELLISGGGVSLGYVGAGALTAARFLPGAGGARRYRTGDLVRWLPEGQLEFLGRTDHQVKVRGFRIELGEVETALRRVAPLREVAVSARGSGPNRRLVAFLVPSEPVPGDHVDWLRGVRERLLADLPVHLVPAEYALLSILPRTPHGKIDRLSLAGAPTTVVAGQNLVAPRTPEEARVAALWSRLLGRADIGVTEDFLELGGHSLVLTRLAAELDGEFGVQVKLADLWQRRTVAAQAELMHDLVERQPAARTEPVQRLDRNCFTKPTGGTP